MKNKIFAILATGMLLGPVAGHAALIEGTFEFTASGFAPVIGTDPAPYDLVTGSFTISIDSSVSVTNSTDGFTLNSLSLPGMGPTGYDYFADSDTILVGGLVTGVGAILSNNFDWWIRINNIFTTPTFGNLSYAVNMGNNWFTTTGTLARVDSVPEPGTLALLGLGLAGIGLARRRKLAA